MSTGIYTTNNEVIIFYVDLPKEGRHFMSIKKQSDLRNIVFLDANGFLDLWRNDPKKSHAHLAYGDAKAWESDYKYKKASDSFSYGLANPVPLASVHCGLTNGGIPYVNLLDGITRTIWLLSKNAKCFPIKTDAPSSKLFNTHIGIDMPVIQLP